MRRKCHASHQSILREKGRYSTQICSARAIPVLSFGGKTIGNRFSPAQGHLLFKSISILAFWYPLRAIKRKTKRDETLQIQASKSAADQIAAASTLTFPFSEPPATGQLIEIVPGILWTRVPLPFRLNHVNIFLIEDGDGWAVVDTGIADDATRELWRAILAGPLAGKRLTRLIVTHHHPDHIGLAGWLCAEHDMPLLTSQTSFLACNNISLSPNALGADQYRDFYRSHGMDDTTAAIVSTQGNNYLRMVAPLPLTFFRLVAGDTLKIGDRSFSIHSGDGHSPEQIMLYCAQDRLFLGADQVLARITPNISVWPVEPDGDPLGLYLRSLRSISATIPHDVLVLPGHELPFFGLHERAAQIIAHHEERCERIMEACRQKPHSVADLVPVLFTRALDPHQTSFAFSETHAHVNRLIHAGDLAWQIKPGGVHMVVPSVV
jgi:glyoxylase-like metal-dependent hydrolase (beta-lactamase superfamily II)